MMKHVLMLLLLTVLTGCGRHEQTKVIVDIMDERPVVITKDGQLLFESKAMSRDELVVMVKERVEKDRQSTVSSQYSTILIEPDSETPNGTVQDIKKLIRDSGGTPGQRVKPNKSMDGTSL